MHGFPVLHNWGVVGFSTDNFYSGLALPVVPVLHCGLSISLDSILKPFPPPAR